MCDEGSVVDIDTEADGHCRGALPPRRDAEPERRGEGGAIRADASAAIGLGHLKRCLSLAQALRAQGAAVTLARREIDLDCAPIEAAGVSSVRIAAGRVSGS